jgi:hypothetical protein
MTGTVDAAARGAIEASERDGGSAQADSAGTQGVVWDHTAFPEGKAVEEVGLRQVYYCPTLLSSILQSGYWRRFGFGRRA